MCGCGVEVDVGVCFCKCECMHMCVLVTFGGSSFFSTLWDEAVLFMVRCVGAVIAAHTLTDVRAYVYSCVVTDCCTFAHVFFNCCNNGWRGQFFLYQAHVSSQ